MLRTLIVLLFVVAPWALGGEAAQVVGELLCPGDQIRIDVFDNPDLSMTVIVPARGIITFPLIGNLPELTTQSIPSLTTWITTQLADGFLRQPHVTITMASYGPRLVHVLGSTARSGAVHLQPGVPMNALQAISEAGGFDTTANRQGCYLVRTNAQGQRTSIALPLTQTAQDHSLDMTVLPGDVIVVPASDRAYVLGRVTHPGPIPFQGTEPVTMARAISLAGGFDRFAVDDGVQLLRPGGVPRTVNCAAILAGKAPDVALQPGDTVFVPESRF